MSTLPDSVSGGAPNDQGTTSKQAAPSVGPVSSSKEVEAGVLGGPEAAFRDVSGAEVELSAEVAATGVKVHPTTVTLPQPVTELGAKPVGGSVVSSQPIATTLPLSDDQIAQGVHQSITSSWRWLAEWCRRKLKQLHVAIKSVHGKIVRVKT